MNLKPLRSNVLIKPTEVQENRIGLIIQSISNEGIIKGVGIDVKELKIGDVVRFDRQTAVTLDSYLLCREADVLCVIEDN